MLELSKKTNLLEKNIYKYSLQDIEEPELYREMFNYEEVPKIAFNHRRVPVNMPEDIWITDTSFRDGQQSMSPYKVKDIVNLYKLLAINYKIKMLTFYQINMYSFYDLLSSSAVYRDCNRYDFPFMVTTVA